MTGVLLVLVPNAQEQTVPQECYALHGGLDLVDFGLYFDELGVFAVLFHEFFVGSTFDHFALFHHDEAAGVAQGRQQRNVDAIR